MGYSVKTCISPDTVDDLICGICNSIVRDPVETSCEHLFCGDEIKAKIEEDGYFMCTVCCKTLHMHDLKEKPHRILQERMDTLLMECPHQECNEVTCEQVNRGLGTLESHIQVCEYRLVHCPNNDCLENIPWNALDAHMETCPYREVQCSKCGIQLIALEIPEHEEKDCPKTMISCDKCEMILEKEHLLQHLQDTCPNVEISCHMEGCGATEMRKDMPDHLELNVQGHLQLVAEELGRMKKEVKELKHHEHPSGHTGEMIVGIWAVLVAIVMVLSHAMLTGHMAHHAKVKILESRLATTERRLAILEASHADSNYVWTIHDFPATEYHESNDFLLPGGYPARMILHQDEYVTIYAAANSKLHEADFSSADEDWLRKLTFELKVQTSTGGCNFSIEFDDAQRAENTTSFIKGLAISPEQWCGDLNQSSDYQILIHPVISVPEMTKAEYCDPSDQDDSSEENFLDMWWPF